MVRKCKAFFAESAAVSRHLPGKIKENHENLEPGVSVRPN